MAKKTFKLKKAGASQEPTLPHDAPVEGKAASTPVVAAVMPAATRRTTSSVSYTASGIAGIIAVILLGVLLILQLVENSEYKGAIPTKGFVAVPTAE